MLVAFGIPGRPVPWKAPTVTRWSTYKNPKLIAWQQHIADCAAKAWTGEPYNEPVEVHVWYCRKRRILRDLLAWCCVRPDLDNVVKAFGDVITGQALKGGRDQPANPHGRIIGDDSSIVSLSVHKLYWNADGLFVAIYTVDDRSPALPFNESFEVIDEPST